MIRALCIASLLLSLGGCSGKPEPRPSPRPVSRPKPPSPFDENFWKHWSDGKVEVCRYHWTRNASKGSLTTYVRVDAARQLVLLLLQRSGETSEAVEVRMPLDGAEGVTHGVVSSISRSLQAPWGHSWEQAIFGPRRVFVTRHRPGEPDSQQVVEHGGAVLPAEAALLWARRIAWPRIRAGASMRVDWVPSLGESRSAILQRSERAASIRVNDGARIWFEVHPALPHPVKWWETSAGETAALIGCDRVAPPAPPTP